MTVRSLVAAIALVCVLPLEARAANRAVLESGGVAAAFSGGGSHFTGGGETLHMALHGAGRPERLVHPAGSKLKVGAGRAEYVYEDGIVEWYREAPGGIEQGFVLPSRPPGRGELTVSISVHGGLIPLQRDGDVTFLSTSGRPAFTYSGLHVFDATGAELPSRIAVTDGRIELRAEDAAAVYPVVVDPLIARHKAKLTASDGASDDRFGESIAVSGDTAVVGAVGDDDQGSVSGSAYVFVKTSSGAWTQQAKLMPSDGAAGDLFGEAVALSGDTAVIGAPFDDTTSPDTGSAYVFVRTSDGIWTQHAKLVPSDITSADEFGSAVSVSGDTALVGAPFDGPLGSARGSAYVFVRSSSGTWIEQAKLTAFDGAFHDQLGSSVSVSADTAILGAPFDDDNGTDSGSAYVFVRSPAGTWTAEAKFTAPDGAPFDRFGYGVAISSRTAIVGVPLDDDRGPNSGSAHVFQRPPSGNKWSRETKLLAADGAQNDEFGSSVAVSGDTAVIAAPLDDDGGFGAGAAYVFSASVPGAWDQLAKLRSPDAHASELFGWSVSVSADTVVVSTPFGEGAAKRSGDAHVFRIHHTPVAGADSFSLAEDSDLTVAGPGVLGNDADPDGDPLAAVVRSGPSHGTLSLSGNGGFAYVPDDDYSGADSFVYDACDPDGGCGSASVTINVRAVNDAPVAAPDAYETDEDAALAVGAPGVLVNDSDVDGDTLRVGGHTDPEHGSLRIRTDGSFVYTPDPDFNGADSFSYSVVDLGGALDVGIVTIDVGSVNDAPSALDDSASTGQYESVTIDVLANDEDVDGQVLSVVGVTPPAHGEAVMQPDGTITYAPGLSFKNGDSFTYTVSDPVGGLSTAKVTVTEDDCGEVDVIDDVVEPAAGSVDPALAKTIHDVNCELA